MNKEAFVLGFMEKLSESSGETKDPYKWHKRLAGTAVAAVGAYAGLRYNKFRKIKNYIGNIKSTKSAIRKSTNWSIGRAKSMAGPNPNPAMTRMLNDGIRNIRSKSISSRNQLLRPTLEKAKKLRSSNVISALFK